MAQVMNFDVVRESLISAAHELNFRTSPRIVDVTLDDDASLMQQVKIHAYSLLFIFVTKTRLGYFFD